MASNYRQEHGFSDIRACDAHIHFAYKRPIGETLDIFRKVREYLDYEGMALMALNETSSKGDDPFNTIKGLYLRERLGDNVFAYASLFHWHDERDTAEGYLQQIRKAYEMGFDGMKMLEGKPTLRKRLGRRQDDPIFDGYYGFAEEHDFPIVLHLGDPAAMWDRSKCSEYAIKAGWFCDETYPKRDELFDEVDGIMTKFPRLRLTLAHLFCRNEDPASAGVFLDRWENTAYDLTPGNLMQLFTEDWQNWRDFIVKYRNRLMYGTDTYNVPMNDNPEKAWGLRPTALRRFIETEEPFVYNEATVRPFKLDYETAKLLLHDNFYSRMGEQHRRADYAAAAQEYGRLRCLLEDDAFGSKTAEVKDLERENLLEMERFFSN